MSKTTHARNVTLLDLETKFALHLTQDIQFFPEWQTDLPEVTEQDKQALDRVKEGYLNHIKYPPMLEDTVKMVVLAPLLYLAGSYLPPFYIKSEQSTRLRDDNEETIIEGKIDFLILKDQFWVTVIESKRAELSILPGLAQLLAYMLASPHPERPTFGMITTGGSFVFIKLTHGKSPSKEACRSEAALPAEGSVPASPQYAISRGFELLNPGNDLYEVLAIVKRLRQL